MVGYKAFGLYNYSAECGLKILIRNNNGAFCYINLPVVFSILWDNAQFQWAFLDIRFLSMRKKTMIVMMAKIRAVTRQSFCAVSP